jgi:hypothetical protein
MSVWSREQISQARGIRARARIDQTLAVRARLDVMSATRQKMFKNMADIGHSFAIELSPTDIQFREAEADGFTIEVVGWWEPQVNEVEFRGGPHDGQRMAIEKPGQPVRLYLPPPMPALLNEGQSEPTSLTNDIATYDVTGWHEQERVWIYEAT